MSATIHISAPGKVMVSGEYVVLDGAPAVVAAAPARAHVRFLPEVDKDAYIPPEATQARFLAEREFGVVAGELSVDTTALRDGARKFGLGSSAAAAAGTVAAVAAAHGVDINDLRTRIDRLLPLALAGHRAVSPEGSGADVAASMLGGFVRFEKHGTDVRADALEWPKDLHTAIIWTGSPARTSDLIARVKKLEAENPAEYSLRFANLREVARVLLDCIERADTSGAIEAADQHGRAMAALGEAADAPIVTAELSRAAALARHVGGAAKPSGAGGGDIAIAFLPSERACSDLGEACKTEGLTLLPFSLGDKGPHLVVT